MNNQITRRNLLKLLGVSGVTLPLTGISKDIDINQAKNLDNLLIKSNQKINYIFFLNVKKDTIIKRIEKQKI